MVEYSNNTRAVGDHNLVSCNIRIKGNARNNTEILRRKWESINIETLKNELSRKNWNRIYDFENPELAYNYLEENILEVLDRLIPVKKIQTMQRNKIEIKPETKELTVERDLARNKAAATNLPEDWDTYKVIRNRSTAAVRKDKKEQLERKYNDCINDKNSSKLFRTMKKQIGIRNGGPPEMLCKEGRKITKPKEIADVQCKYFSDKINNLKTNIQGSNSDPLELLKKAMDKWGNAADLRPKFKLTRNIHSRNPRTHQLPRKQHHNGE